MVIPTSFEAQQLKLQQYKKEGTSVKALVPSFLSGF